MSCYTLSFRHTNGCCELEVNTRGRSLGADNAETNKKASDPPMQEEEGGFHGSV